jgi:tetratricopeptide (TPR) repeat protein
MEPRLSIFLVVVILTASLAWSLPNSATGAYDSATQSPAQNQSAPPANPPQDAPQESHPQSSAPQNKTPNLAPPRSDSVNADALDDEGQSSSKDTQIDISAPDNDATTHPDSSDMLHDEGGSTGGNGDVIEFHPWNPHKAAKDIEVGDFYFKRKNYRAAEDRYREALLFKNNDALATYRLAVCLEKLDRPDDARQEYESYLKILPHGPQAEEAQKSISRLKNATASAKPSK